MNLAIDIGNTRTKFGFFKNGRLRKKLYWEKTDLRKLETLLSNQKVENIICSTVKTVDFKFEKRISKNRFYIRLEANTPLPIQNKYRTPKTLGKDRLAAVVGAFELYPNTSSLVIDAGTCITYDVINAKGDFLGGNIVPGLEMRYKAMHHFTAQLPLIERKGGRIVDIGKDTNSAMRTGGALGTMLEMEAWIQYFKKEYEVINTILTGGDGDYFAKKLKSKIFAHPNLVLIGLNKILQHNVEILA